MSLFPINMLKLTNPSRRTTSTSSRITTSGTCWKQRRGRRWRSRRSTTPTAPNSAVRPMSFSSLIPPSLHTNGQNPQGSPSPSSAPLSPTPSSSPASNCSRRRSTISPTPMASIDLILCFFLPRPPGLLSFYTLGNLLVSPWLLFSSGGVAVWGRRESVAVSCAVHKYRDLHGGCLGSL